LAASIVVYCSPDIANIYGTVRVEGKFVHDEGEGSFSNAGCAWNILLNRAK